MALQTLSMLSTPLEMTAVQPVTSIETPVYSEVQPRNPNTADRQISVSKIISESSSDNVHTQNLAKRWHSAKFRTSKKDQTTSPINKKQSVFSVEDSFNLNNEIPN
jgi:hypothetical protein